MGPYHKQISCDSVEYNNENGEKCKKDEVDKLLSYKKFLLNQPRIEKWYISYFDNKLKVYIK